MKLTAQQLGPTSKDSDQIVIRDGGGTAWGLLHIDAFWEHADDGDPNNRTIYNALFEGREIVLNVTLQEG